MIISYKMKKILSLIVLAGLVSALALPSVVSAQTPIPSGCTMRHDLTGLEDLNCPGEGQFCDKDDQGRECGMCCVLNSVFTVTNWIFYILTLLVVVMIIIGGFTIITASGSPERAAKGRAILTYAIIGLAIALLAKIIPSIVSFIIGI